MNDQNLARLEASLERLIEGAFTQLFSRAVRAQDIALQLARALEMNAEPAVDGDPRPVAPDVFTIHLNGTELDLLLAREPHIADLLAHHLVALAVDAGYRLNAQPMIHLEADGFLSQGSVSISADHSTHTRSATAVMERVDVPTPAQADQPKNAQLILNGQQTFHLRDTIVDLGRSRDNQIVLDDPFVSRHHAQLRLRFGRYTLFDAESQSGTYVNNTPIREHTLQSGDVIRMGKMQLVYLEDDPSGESQTNLNLTSDLS
jgi:hypothetical protein